MAKDDLISGLQSKIDAAQSRHKPATREDKDRVFGYLDEQLRSYDLEGHVVTVLTRTDRGEIICYGQKISAENLLLGLNMNIGARGPAVTSPPGTSPEKFVEHGPLAQRVSYRELHRLTTFQEGFLVLLRPLDKNDQKYAALINIDIDFDDHRVTAYHFPKNCD